METERFKKWLVDVLGLDRSEANDICVSGYPLDVETKQKLFLRYIREVSQPCEVSP